MRGVGLQGIKGVLTFAKALLKLEEFFGVFARDLYILLEFALEFGNFHLVQHSCPPSLSWHDLLVLSCCCWMDGWIGRSKLEVSQISINALTCSCEDYYIEFAEQNAN